MALWQDHEEEVGFGKGMKETGIPERALFEDGERGSEVWNTESFSLAHGRVLWHIG